MGILHAPTPGSVSPALFHGESLVARNKSSASSSRPSETAPRQETVRQENNVIHVGAQYSKTTRSIHPRISDTPTLPPSAKSSSNMDFDCQKKRATPPRMIHPAPPPPPAASCMHGDPYGQSAQEGEVIMFSAQRAWSVRMHKYNKTFHRMNQTTTSLATCMHQR